MNTHRCTFVTVLSLLALHFVFMSPCRGDGLIVVKDSPHVPGHFPFAPLQVTYHRVSVQIEDELAVTSVDQEFYNPNARQLEGTYIFPLPEGAHIEQFSMEINGKQMPAELLPADKARSMYEAIVRQYKDPALLEYVGRGAMKVRIFPIEANGRKPVKLRYAQVLKRDSGLLEYVYPLSTEKFSSQPLGDVSINVSLACRQPIKAVYCPSHDVQIRRENDRQAVVTFAEKNSRPDTDFKLIFARSGEEVGIDLLTYRNSPDEGYFMLIASPGMQTSPGEIQHKDVCFVIDTSGSMAGPKLDQARKALLFCLANLNGGDRFEIVRFSTEADALFGALSPATSENVARARNYVEGLKPMGGTAIHDALKLAQSGRRERPYVVIFLTDGQPTVGETNEDKLVALSHVPESSGAAMKIFPFGIGTAINTHLLDRLANETRAFSQYVLPEEDIELKVSSFYTKISSPVLTDVRLAFDGKDVAVSQMYPGTMPDLYSGQTLVAFGRYRGAGPAAVRMTGTLNSQPREVVATAEFVEHDITAAFIPRLWATRRVGWLLDEIRLRGESQELKDEVVRLAREHGIVTPYTAYLILEDERQREVPVALRSFRELEADGIVLRGARDAYDASRVDSGRTEKSGDRAVANAANVQALKLGANEQQAAQAYALTKPAAGATTQPAGYRQAQNYAQQVRVVRGRSFYQNGNVWTDVTAQQKHNALKREEVAFNSADYFALLARHPDAAAWLALGAQLDVVLGDTLYVIR